MFLESSRNGDEIKELSTVSKLKDNKVNYFVLSTALFVCVCSILNLINDIWMVDLRHGFDFGHEEFFSF